MDYTGGDLAKAIQKVTQVTVVTDYVTQGIPVRGEQPSEGTLASGVTSVTSVTCPHCGHRFSDIPSFDWHVSTCKRTNHHGEHSAAAVTKLKDQILSLFKTAGGPLTCPTIAFRLDIVDKMDFVDRLVKSLANDGLVVESPEPGCWRLTK